jgi:hypothetical protein
VPDLEVKLEVKPEVAEATGEELSVTTTRAEAAAEVGSAGGMVSAGEAGTAVANLGRTSDQSINQSY